MGDLQSFSHVTDFVCGSCPGFGLDIHRFVSEPLQHCLGFVLLEVIMPKDESSS